MNATVATSPRALPVEEVLLPSAPVLPEPEAAANLTVLMPLTGALGSVAMVVGIAPGGSLVRALVMAGSVVVSAGLMVLVQVVRQRSQRARTVARAREEHLRAVEQISAELRARRRRQVDDLQQAWPAPVRWDAPAIDSGLPRPDALDVRCGVASRPAPNDVVVDAAAPGVPDPVCRTVLERFAAAHDHVDEVPVVVDLRSLEHVVVEGGERDDVLRAWVVQAARLSPDELAVAVVADLDDVPRWDWLKWLPHAWSADRARVLLDTDPAALLTACPQRRHLLLVDARAVPAAHEGVTSGTVVSGPCAVPEGGRVLRVVLDDASPAGPAVDGVRTFTPDRCSATAAAALARRSIAGCEPVAAAPRPATAMAVDLAPRHRDDLLKVLVGHTPDGVPVHLDLKESAHGGHGPHGLLVGATGSGKSEFLRTLVMGIVTTHLPEDAALVLVDFKGGATFSDLDDLPHVAACVTNLSDAVGLVDRMQDALGGEMERRQELLHAHGFANVTDYRAARTAGADLAPLPHLFVCVDEFSELLTARPEFVELFTAVGRLGRSLGIHLLLASQRLDEGRLHALEAHLSYRIALRTFSASESRAAIGVPDAHSLPRRPGVGLFRSGADAPTRFDAVHLGAPAPAPGRGAARRARVEVLSALTAPAAQPAGGGGHPRTDAQGITWGEHLLGSVREASAGVEATRRVWLPPLTFAVDLGRLVSDVRVDTLLGLHSPALRKLGGLRLPVGLVDRPRLQRHDVLGLDLSGPRGHVAVVGAPRSGRSTALQTLVSALALARTPDEAHLHLVDLGGGALAPLTHLPHVVSHVTRDTPDLLARVVAEVERTVEERERRRSEGAIAASDETTAVPEVFLVIDGWGVLRTEHDDLERRLVHLAARGLGAGVHLVLTAVRWTELRPALLDVVGSRVELRLGDPYESVVDRRAAALVPVDLPGRGIAAGSHGAGPSTTRIAQPRLFADDPGSLSTAEVTCRAVAQHWTRPVPARLRELPESVTLADLSGPVAARLRVGVDWTGHTLSVPAAEHVVVQGPAGSGRSNALRHLVTEWTRAHPGGQVVLVDPRGTLDGLVDEAHLLAHATTSGDATTTVRSVAEHLLRREERESAAPVPVLVAVDDLELLRDLGGDLSALTPLLARAASFGLSVVATARTSPSRMPDRTVSLLVDLGASTVVLDGSRPGRATLSGAGIDARRVQLPASSRPETGAGSAATAP